ncbi:hypothetical protein CXR23_02900 [Brevibacterium aurantiacum]|uniref:Uncharacterized protein n=1 Tax=Brevibacterium aurantiacum TaxID=273384 RepID=A0A3T0DBH7_BREAU|nr:hypothetical protein [Brevibacterium aurantiacum]AZT92219.1 hypothetical protein CXR23_02900 [Brevibacterium aurantiacum]
MHGRNLHPTDSVNERAGDDSQIVKPRRQGIPRFNWDGFAARARSDEVSRGQADIDGGELIDQPGQCCDWVTENVSADALNGSGP